MQQSLETGGDGMITVYTPYKNTILPQHVCRQSKYQYQTCTRQPHTMTKLPNTNTDVV